MQMLGFTTDDDIVLVHQEFKYLQISTLSVSLSSIFCVINFGGGASSVFFPLCTLPKCILAKCTGLTHLIALRVYFEGFSNG